MKKETRFAFGPEFRKADEDGKWTIEGYASTDAVDSYNEIVDPEAFRSSLASFSDFPILLLNHEFFDAPVGKVTDVEIRPRGLWVKAEISKSAPQVWQLINEGILKAFSIGFQGRKVERNDGDAPDVWREIDLLEISVVNIPANREALFSVAASKGISLTQFTKQTAIPTTHKAKGAGNMTDFLTKEEAKQVVETEIKSQLPDVEGISKKAAQDVATNITATFKTQHDDTSKQLKEIAEQLQGCTTKAEFEEMRDKVEKDVAALLAVKARQGASGINTLEESLANSPHLESKAAYFKSVAEERNCAPSYVRAMTSKPEELTSNSEEQAAIKALHRANDELHLLDILARAANPFGYRGPQTLKAWNHWKRTSSEFRKAMDTATATEGNEWLPTGFSSDLQDRVELAARVAPLFKSFSQPTKSYTWPIKSTRGTAYLIAESLTDSASKITATTPLTANVTFTAKKLAMRALTSTEFIEDSIVPVLSFLLDDIATTLARAWDDAIINGDTSASHQDSNVTAATDHRKAVSGLRYRGLNGTSSSASTTSATMANIRTIWKLMLDYGFDPSDLALILNVRDYIQLMADSEITKMDGFGARATNLSGTLPQVMGIDVVVSPHAQVNLNASGVYDNTTKTKGALLLVHKPSYMIGDRRMVSVETDKDIETDQMIVVGTMRKDFQAMDGGGQNPVVIGYATA